MLHLVVRKETARLSMVTTEPFASTAVVWREYLVVSQSDPYGAKWNLYRIASFCRTEKTMESGSPRFNWIHGTQLNAVHILQLPMCFTGMRLVHSQHSKHKSDDIAWQEFAEQATRHITSSVSCLTHSLSLLKHTGYYCVPHTLHAKSLHFV